MQVSQQPTLAPASVLDSPSTPSDSSTSTNSNTNITANDFLTLLVAEMKNQDPTATTDPNAYIDQLVQVNSLEQLVQINQGIGNLGSSSSSSSSSGLNSGQDIARHSIGTAGRLANALSHANSTAQTQDTTASQFAAVIHSRAQNH